MSAGAIPAREPFQPEVGGDSTRPSIRPAREQNTEIKHPRVWALGSAVGGRSLVGCGAWAE